MADTQSKVPSEQVEQLEELRDQLAELAATAHDQAYDQDGYDFEKNDALAAFHECVSDAKDDVDRALNLAYNVNTSSPGRGYDL